MGGDFFCPRRLCHGGETRLSAGQSRRGWDVKLPGPVNKLYSQVANIHTQLANVYTELANIRTQLANIVWVRRPPGLCAGVGRSVCVAGGFSSGRRANFMPRGDAVWPMGANFAARAARRVP